MGNARQSYPDDKGTKTFPLYGGQGRERPTRKADDRTYSEPTEHRKAPKANSGEKPITGLPWGSR